MNNLSLEMKEGIKCPGCYSFSYKKYKLDDSFLPDKVGYCQDCGYCLTHFEYSNIQRRIIADFDESRFARQLQGESRDGETDYPWVLKSEYITSSLRDNILIKYLTNYFSLEAVYKAAASYGLMSQKKWKSDKWHGAVAFFQYNACFEKISFKIMQYDEKGHPVKGAD